MFGGHTDKISDAPQSEQSLVRLTVDDSGRIDQQTFPLPELGKRVMHRIA